MFINNFFMFDKQPLCFPENLIKPAATIAGGMFLFSPLGIPLYFRGVSRVFLAGLGGFLAGRAAEKVVDTFAENLGQVMQQNSEGNRS
jgi:hypothetical protein